MKEFKQSPSSGVARLVLIGGPLYKKLKAEGWRPGEIAQYVPSVEQFSCYLIMEDDIRETKSTITEGIL
jgi:hypothetical protein